MNQPSGPATRVRLESAVTALEESRALYRRLIVSIDQVTHELRTPLTPLRSALEILLGGMAGEITCPRQREMLETMERSVQRLSGAVENLAATLEGGVLPPEEIPGAP